MASTVSSWNLPVEVTAKILAFVPPSQLFSVQRVCRVFRDASMDALREHLAPRGMPIPFNWNGGASQVMAYVVEQVRKDQGTDSEFFVYAAHFLGKVGYPLNKGVIGHPDYSPQSPYRLPLAIVEKLKFLGEGYRKLELLLLSTKCHQATFAILASSFASLPGSSSIGILKEFYGEENAGAITKGLDRLGLAFEKQGKHSLAMDYFAQSYVIKRLNFGEVHLDCALSMQYLGLAYEKGGDFEVAFRYFELCCLIRQRILGEDHPDVAESLRCIGFVVNALGNTPLAIEYLTKSLAIYRKNYEEEHPHVVKARRELSGLKEWASLLEAEEEWDS